MAQVGPPTRPAPATLGVARLPVPETATPLTRGTAKMEVEKTSSNIIDAAAAGAGDGLKLALNIGAMLLAFIALIGVGVIRIANKWLGLAQVAREQVLAARIAAIH